MPSFPAARRATGRRRTRLAVVAAALGVVVLLAIAWSFAPLATFVDAARIVRWRAAARDWPLAPVVAVAAYVALGFVAAPASALIGATMLLFGPVGGAAVAFAGMLASGLATYGAARFVARDVVASWLSRREGSRLDALNRLLARRGFAAVALMRLTPTPYMLQNVLAGAARIAVVPFAAGTAVGIVPVIALIAGLATPFAPADDDGSSRVVVAVAIIAVAIAVLLAARRAWRAHSGG